MSTQPAQNSTKQIRVAFKTLIAQWIKSHREMAGRLSQEHCAELAGVEARTWQSWEGSGSSPPKWPNFEKIVDGLNFAYQEVGSDCVLHAHIEWRQLLEKARQIVNPTGEIARPSWDDKALTIRANATMPDSIELVTRTDTPQWTAFRVLDLEKRKLHSLSCIVTTSSPYFRFGFKLLTGESRYFGETTIRSTDYNIVVHIGRNDWGRPSISPHQLFYTYNINGKREAKDQPIRQVSKKVCERISLTSTNPFEVCFKVGESHSFSHNFDMTRLAKILICAWGDSEDYAVTVSDLTIRVL